MPAELKTKFYPDKDLEKYLVEKHINNTPEFESLYRYIFQFPNRFGIMITKNPYSSGYEDDLWDLSVLHFNLDPWFDYILIRTPETPGIILQKQTDGQVTEWLRKVKDWPFEKYKEL